MKKIVITALIALSFQGAYAAELVESPYDLDTMFDKYYEAPLSALPENETETALITNMTSEATGNPVFRRIRIKITNFFRAKDNAYYEKQQKELEKEILGDVENEENAEVTEALETDLTGEEQPLELTGGVKEEKKENDVVLDCDNVIYDEVANEMQAIGSPVLSFPPQQVTLKADKITYNNESNIIKAYGNVRLEKANSTVYGDYMQINMNEENAFMDKIKFKQGAFRVNARKSSAESDKIVLEDGDMKTEGSYVLRLQSRMIKGQDFDSILVTEDEKSSLTDFVGEIPFKITAEKIVVEGKKDHDTVTLEDGKIYYGDTKLWRFKKFTAHTDKSHSYFEANYPEIGSRARLGMYVGPSWVFDMPNGAVVKAIPFLNYKGGLGVGGAIKYRSANNTTDMAYGSAEDIFVLRGRQRLDDKLYLQYGVNSYMNEGFFGQNMAKYALELYYQDRTRVRDTLAKGLDLRFTQKAGLGYMHNTSYNKYYGNTPQADIGTARFRYMAEIDQSVFRKEDRENLKIFDLSISMQGSASIYGTGDTQFIGRVGPRIHTQYKRWMQDIAYYLSAFDDNTPLTRFDKYRYGRSSIYIREALRVCKYLSVGWTGNVNLSDDAPDGRVFQENAFVIAVGPDDFKLNLGYDFIRQQTYFSFTVATDTKNSTVEYKKMEIKNPDRIAKNDTKPVKLIPTFEEIQRAKYEKKPTKVLKYAEVIDIEDPDREQL